MLVEVFPDKSKKWRYRQVAPNGEPIAQSESYASKANAKRAAETNVEGWQEIRVLDKNGDVTDTIIR